MRTRASSAIVSPLQGRFQERAAPFGTKYPPWSRWQQPNVSFAIQPGEFVFLVGQSGSGKSTTMRLLIKETEATSGTIRVAGRELDAISRRRVPYYRRNIGVV